MATLSPTPAIRQPFAPINGARLQNLTSLKNRQNALPTSLASPSKRKAVVYEEDAENMDPIIFASPKRTKGQDGTETFKPSASHFVLTKTPTPSFKDFAASCSPVKPVSTRPMLQPRSPALKLNAPTTSTLSAPAGRSPTRQRIGILSRRRTTSSFTRVDPPKFSIGPVADAPFSIAAALSGTIPSYGARQAQASVSSKASSTSISRSILEPERRSGWFFDIHEDTPEEMMTNLMEHSTCILDISSDEETEARRRDERGKENVPPLDDISQTQARLPTSSSSEPCGIIAEAKARTRSMRRRKEIDEDAIDVDRSPLGDLEAEEFYAEGCTSSDVILVADEEADAPESDVEALSRSEDPQAQVQTDEGQLSEPYDPAMPGDEQLSGDASSYAFDFSLFQKEWTGQANSASKARFLDVDALMTRSDADKPLQAKLFEPLEKAEEDFEVWESGSAKGEQEGEDEVVL